METPRVERPIFTIKDVEKYLRSVPTQRFNVDHTRTCVLGSLVDEKFQPRYLVVNYENIAIDGIVYQLENNPVMDWAREYQERLADAPNAHDLPSQDALAILVELKNEIRDNGMFMIRREIDDEEDEDDGMADNDSGPVYTKADL